MIRKLIFRSYLPKHKLGKFYQNLEVFLPNQKSPFCVYEKDQLTWTWVIFCLPQNSSVSCHCSVLRIIYKLALIFIHLNLLNSKRKKKGKMKGAIVFSNRSISMMALGLYAEYYLNSNLSLYLFILLGLSYFLFNRLLLKND